MRSFDPKGKVLNRGLATARCPLRSFIVPNVIPFGYGGAPVVSSSEGTAILGANERSEFAPVV